MWDFADVYALACEQVTDIAGMIGVIHNLCNKNFEYVGYVYEVADSVFQLMKRVFVIMD